MGGSLRVSWASIQATVMTIACAVGCSSNDSGTTNRSIITPPAGIPAGGAGAPIASGSAGRSTGAPLGGSAAPPANPPMMPGPGPGASAGMTAQPMAGMGAIAGSGGAPVQMPTPRGGDTCLQAGDGTYEEQGPYRVGMMDVSIGSNGMYTIFYPDPLESSCPHPIVAWGNGTGVTGSTVYAFFNSNAASWGMVVAASHESNTGTGTFHTAALDWLLAQNADSSSMFYQKLSTRAGTSGHSQGGFGATRGAAHANVEAQVSVGASGTSSAKVSLLILTGTNDLGPDADRQIANASGSAFVAIWDGGDHVTTETLAGYISGDKGSLQMQRLYAAWFRCFLADDGAACAMFSGGTPDGCGICSDMGWFKLASKNL